MFFTLVRKSVKYLRISVAPDGGVFVSAPKRVSYDEIVKFVDSKKEWIIKAQEHYKKAKSLVVMSNDEVLLHGQGYTIELVDTIQ